MEKKVYSGDLGFFCKASHFLLYLTFLITTTLADHVFHRLLWLQHMCIFMCKISIHSSSPMLTKKDKNWKKKKKKELLIQVFFERKKCISFWKLGSELQRTRVVFCFTSPGCIAAWFIPKERKKIYIKK